MQLVNVCSRVGQLRSSVVKTTSIADRLPAASKLCAPAMMSGIICQAPSLDLIGAKAVNGLAPSISRTLKTRKTSGTGGFHSSPIHFASTRAPVIASASAQDGINDLKAELTESSGKEEAVSDSKKIVCEFVLQTFFNFLSVTAVAMAVNNSAGNAVLQTLQVMGAHAVILPLTIYAGAEVSGSHFNPVVTACFVLIGKLSLRTGLGYVLAQLAGGVLGAAAAFSSLPKSMQTLSHAGLQSVPAGSTVQQAFVGEICGAFALVLVLFSTNLDPRSQWGKLKPLAIPLIVTLLMWLLGPVSSTCINPARAFGPAVVTGFWEHHWIWWTAPFIGGLSAAKIYHSIFLSPKLRAQL